MTIREGELHPFLTKIETKFFPRRNRINRLDLFFGQLGAAIAILVIFFAPGFILNLFADKYVYASIIGMLCYVFGVLLYVYITVRADYYRLQDLNIDGSVAYQILALQMIFAILQLVIIFYAPGTSSLWIWKIFDGLSFIYGALLLFMPGTNGDNKFGPRPVKPVADEAELESTI